jgi:hypothetical protein
MLRMQHSINLFSFRQMYITNFALFCIFRGSCQRVVVPIQIQMCSANTDTNVHCKDGYKLNHS